MPCPQPVQGMAQGREHGYAMGLKRFRFRAVAGVVTAGVLAAGVVATVVIPAGASQPQTTADESPPYAVEDFNYPGAAAIEEQRGFVLKRGDGHLVLTDRTNSAECVAENLLVVHARGLDDEAVCFRLTGDEGWLTLELSGAYLVHTNDAGNTQLELAAESGDTQSFEIDPECWASVGEAYVPPDDPDSLCWRAGDDTDPGSAGQEFALLEIRVTR